MSTSPEKEILKEEQLKPRPIYTAAEMKSNEEIENSTDSVNCFFARHFCCCIINAKVT